MKKVLFTFSSGGIGHATRSLAIANYLKNKDTEIVFGGFGPGLELIKLNGFEVYKLPQPKFFPLEKIKIKDLIKPYFQHRKEYLKLFREFRPDVHVCDMELVSLIIGKIYARYNFLITHEFKPFNFKLGFKGFLRKWIIKNKEVFADITFYTWIEDIPLKQNRRLVGPLAYEEPAKKLSGKNKILYIPTGTSKNSVNLSEISKNIDATIYSRGDNGKNICKLKKVPNLFPYIKGVDLVICSGYSSIMECIIARTPCIVLPNTVEQIEVAEKCKLKGLCEIASKEDLLDKVSKLLFDFEARRNMIRKQKKLKNGAKEIANFILSLE